MSRNSGEVTKSQQINQPDANDEPCEALTNIEDDCQGDCQKEPVGRHQLAVAQPERGDRVFPGRDLSIRVFFRMGNWILGNGKVDQLKNFLRIGHSIIFACQTSIQLLHETKS